MKHIFTLISIAVLAISVNAQLQIASNGQVQVGNVSVTVEGNTLNAGMYIYALIVNGVEVYSKRMILTD